MEILDLELNPSSVEQHLCAGGTRSATAHECLGGIQSWVKVSYRPGSEVPTLEERSWFLDLVGSSEKLIQPTVTIR